MPQKERLRVWNGELKRTAGGLTRKDMMKNSRGKIVSRKKSGAASKENNLGQWLRKKGDSFSGKLVEAGLPAAAGKGVAKKPKPKPPKAPKGPASSARRGPAKQPKVDKKIAAAAAPKPKPKLRLKLSLKPKSKPPKTPKPKPKPKPKPALRTSPIKAGEVKDYAHISVGNIMVPKPMLSTKPNAQWPDWAKKQTHKKIVRKIKLKISARKGAQNVHWDDFRKYTLSKMKGFVR